MYWIVKCNLCESYFPIAFFLNIRVTIPLSQLTLDQTPSGTIYKNMDAANDIK